MMRSLYSGVSGLRNHQTRMDVIGNNIANVNTIGFKGSRVVFQDLFSQTTRSASGEGASVGGTNPQQIGLGVSTATIDIMQTRSATQYTGNPLDLAIEGDSFFCIEGNGGLYYTRAGNFSVDDNNNLVAGNGYFLMVYPNKAYDASGNEIDADMTSSHWIKATQDSNGKWVKEVDLDGRQPERFQLDRDKYTNINIDQNGVITAISKVDSPTMVDALDENGQVMLDDNNQPIKKPVYAKDDRVVLGVVAMTNFNNPNALEKTGGNMYVPTKNSGDPDFTVAGEDGAGLLSPGTLEMSNVDLSNEFTDMIITQRGFQANSRIITVSDTMLEELVNLKR